MKDKKSDQLVLNKQVGGSHYKDLVIQPAVYGELNKLTFLETSVVKYISRHRKKNGEQDIDKAIQCLQLIKSIVYGSKDAVKETIDTLLQLMKED